MKEFREKIVNIFSFALEKSMGFFLYSIIIGNWIPYIGFPQKDTKIQSQNSTKEILSTIEGVPKRLKNHSSLELIQNLSRPQKRHHNSNQSVDEEFDKIRFHWSISTQYLILFVVRKPIVFKTSNEWFYGECTFKNNQSNTIL